jgi:hypothetical protein
MADEPTSPGPTDSNERDGTFTHHSNESNGSQHSRDNSKLDDARPPRDDRRGGGNEKIVSATRIYIGNLPQGGMSIAFGCEPDMHQKYRDVADRFPL